MGRIPGHHTRGADHTELKPRRQSGGSLHLMHTSVGAIATAVLGDPGEGFLLSRVGVCGALPGLGYLIRSFFICRQVGVVISHMRTGAHRKRHPISWSWGHRQS